jgi:hypothetical protein
MPHLCLKGWPRFREFLRYDFLGSTGRPVDDGRNAAAILKQSPLVFGMKTDVGEAGEMEDSPESIVAV